MAQRHFLRIDAQHGVAGGAGVPAQRIDASNASA
jgi:hypothetical protein